MLQILGLLTRLFERKNATCFPKMRWGQKPFGTFPKVHPFWYRHPSFRSQSTYPKTTKGHILRHKSFLQIYVVVVIVILIYIASKMHCVHLDSSLVAGLVQGSPITKPLRSFVKHKVLV